MCPDSTVVDLMTYNLKIEGLNRVAGTLGRENDCKGYPESRSTNRIRNNKEKDFCLYSVLFMSME